MFQRKTILAKRPTQRLHGKSIFNEWKFLNLVFKEFFRN